MTNKEIQFATKYKTLTFIYLNDILFFSDNLNKDIEENKKLILNDDYLKVLNNQISIIIKYKTCPEEIKNNVNILISFIEKNKQDSESKKIIEDIRANLNTWNNYSYDYFYNQFVIKYNALKNFNNNDYIVWNKKDMLESIRFDLDVILLLVYSDDHFLFKYSNDYIFNKKFIYSIRRILNDSKDLFDNIDFTNKILMVLKTNIILCQNIDLDAIKLYRKQNYNDDSYVSKEEIENFVSENKQLKDTIESKNKLSFRYDILRQTYMHFYIENYLFNNGKLDERKLSLEDIYIFVDEVYDQPFTLKSKNKLICILDKLKKNSDNLNIEEYNKYLVMVNSLKIGDVGYKETNNYLKNRITSNNLFYYIKSDNLIDLVDSIDFDFKTMELFMMSDNEYKDNRQKYYNQKTIYCLNYILNYNPYLIIDETLYQRVVDIIENTNIKKSQKKKILIRFNNIKR